MGFLAGALLVISAVTGAASIDEQKRTNRRAEKIEDVNQRQAAVQNQRERRKAAVGAAVGVARIRAAGATSGATSTAFQTAVTGVGSQLSSNIGFQNHLEQLDQLRFRLQKDLLSSQSRVQEFGALSSLSASAASAEQLR